MLRINNLEVVYHSVVRVLRGVSLEVGKGKIVALLGPNGAGKTTTLRAIGGLLPIHEGKITKGSAAFEGQDLFALKPEKIVQCGITQVMEGRRIFADLTVEENLLAGGYTQSRKQNKEDLEKYYQQFPVLGERKRQQAGYLSGGEQQMLAIARALMSHPTLLLLDEPSLGLAPKIVEDVAKLILQIRSEGVSILLVEQNASVALSLADYGYILENGKVVFDGTPAQLQADKDIQEFYLGQQGHDSEHKSFRDIKRYRRRKRWLS